MSKQFSSLPITDFRNRIGDLARPNLFHIEMTLSDLEKFLQLPIDAQAK